MTQSQAVSDLATLDKKLEQIASQVQYLMEEAERASRRGRILDKMLDSMESAMDLAQTVGPLADDVFGKATDLLQRAEQKGYFTAARAGVRLADDLVTSFNEEDSKQHEKVSLWGLLRQMRDPDVRRGLASVMRVLKIVGRRTAGEQ